MRVIAGTKKGIDLRCGRGPQFRPTAQLVRGSVFDTLGGEVAGAAVLDLFAGSGAFGIEALSRGASRAVFVEQDHAILRALRTNLERCRFGPGVADVWAGDAMRFLDRIAPVPRSFDIVFADPPYASALAQRVIDVIAGAAAPCCDTLVVEHGKPVTAPAGGSLELAKTRQFGQTSVSYFRPRKEVGGGEWTGGTLPGDV